MCIYIYRERERNVYVKQLAQLSEATPTRSAPSSGRRTAASSNYTYIQHIKHINI